MIPLTLAIAPERDQTRMLMMCGQTELLKAVLAPPSMIHPRAAMTLLEGLSLWQQTALSVVLSVDAAQPAFEWGLCDRLGYGHRSVHYEVAIAMRDERARRKSRIEGFGHFRELQKLCLERGHL